jgi:hypothetical protein
MNSLFSMEVAGGSMCCVAGSVGCHQVAAGTTVVAGVRQEPVLAGSAVALPSSAASCAAATKKTTLQTIVDTFFCEASNGWLRPSGGEFPTSMQ